jgi:hypothetical protein
MSPLRLRLERKADDWDPAEHPRDREGRFIEVGAWVRIWGGAQGRVLRNLAGGRLEVEAGGRKWSVHRNYITVVQRPDGSAPTADPDRAQAAPVRAPSPDTVTVTEEDAPDTKPVYTEGVGEQRPPTPETTMEPTQGQSTATRTGNRYTVTTPDGRTITRTSNRPMSHALVRRNRDHFGGYFINLASSREAAEREARVRADDRDHIEVVPIVDADEPQAAPEPAAAQAVNGPTISGSRNDYGETEVFVEPYRATDVRGYEVEVSEFTQDDTGRPVVYGYKIKRDGTPGATRQVVLVPVPDNVRAELDRLTGAEAEPTPEPAAAPEPAATEYVEARDVSTALRRAGYVAARSSRTRVRGAPRTHPGFQVRRHNPLGTPRNNIVIEVSWQHDPDASVAAEIEKLAEMRTALQAEGFRVETALGGRRLHVATVRDVPAEPTAPPPPGEPPHHQGHTPLDYRGKFPGTGERLYLTEPGYTERRLAKLREWTGRDVDWDTLTSGGNFQGAPTDLTAYLDYSVVGDKVYIWFLTTQDDKRNEGLAGRLVAELYARHPDKVVEWGELMDHGAEVLYKRYLQSHPEQTGKGYVHGRWLTGPPPPDPKLRGLLDRMRAEPPPAPEPEKPAGPRSYRTGRIGAGEARHAMETEQASGYLPGYTVEGQRVIVHDPAAAIWTLEGQHSIAVDNAGDPGLDAESRRRARQERDALGKLIEAIQRDSGLTEGILKRDPDFDVDDLAGTSKRDAEPELAATDRAPAPRPADPGTVFFVVPCGGAKLDHPAPAEQLYTGSAYRHVLNAAKTEAEATERDLGIPARVLIMSAKHGLVDLDTVLEPYDVQIGDPDAVGADDLFVDALAANVIAGGGVYTMLPSGQATPYFQRLEAALRSMDVYPQNIYEAAPGIGYQRGVASSLIRNADNRELSELAGGAEPEPEVPAAPEAPTFARGDRVRHLEDGRTGVITSAKPTGDKRRPNALRHTVRWDDTGSSSRTSLNKLTRDDPPAEPEPVAETPATGPRVPLTDFQRGEVRGLLDVVDDDIANGEDRIVWGRIDEAGDRSLIVLDADEAIEELRYRADFMVDEGYTADAGTTATAGARSLQGLADKIAQAAADPPAAPGPAVQVEKLPATPANRRALDRELDVQGVDPLAPIRAELADPEATEITVARDYAGRIVLDHVEPVEPTPADLDALAPPQGGLEAVADAAAPPDPAPGPEAGVELPTEVEYEFPRHLETAAVASIEAANKRAARAGITERFTYELEHFDAPVPDSPGEFEARTRLKLNRPTVKRDGWTFVATLTWDEEAGLVTRTVPGATLLDRPEARRCDVCKSNRDRRDTYVVQRGGAEELQVGSNCLQQFMGIGPSGLWMLGFEPDVDDDPDKEDRGYGGHADRRWSSERALAVTLALVEEQGWISRTRARDTEGMPGHRSATADLVSVILANSGRGRDFQTMREQVLAKAADLADDARELLDFARTLEGDSDYETNLRAVAGPDTVAAANLPLLASAVAARNARREREVRQERAARAAEVSRHVGAEGDKLPAFDARVLSVRTIDGAYGTTTLFTFMDEAGNVFKWFASGNKTSLASIDDTVTVAGTVKKHDEFRGVAETVLTRARVKRSAEAQAALEAREAAAEAARQAEAEERRRVEELARTELPEDYTPYSGDYPLPVGTGVRWRRSGGFGYQDGYLVTEPYLVAGQPMVKVGWREPSGLGRSEAVKLAELVALTPDQDIGDGQRFAAQQMDFEPVWPGMRRLEFSDDRFGRNLHVGQTIRIRDPDTGGWANVQILALSGDPDHPKVVVRMPTGDRRELPNARYSIVAYYPPAEPEPDHG